MPYNPQEVRHAHLQLVVEDRSHDRRRRPAPPSPPPPRVRGFFGPSLSAKLQELEATAGQAQIAAPGLQPHLIFRIPLAKGVVVDSISSLLRSVGLIPVSIEPDRAVIAFRNDIDLTEFQRAIASYVRGPRKGINPTTGEEYKTTKWDLFEYIDPDGLKLWSRSDRIGPRLGQLIGQNANRINLREIYIVDVELWHRGTRDLAETSLQELRNLLRTSQNVNNQVLDHFVGENLCLARVRVNGEFLSKLLDLSVVAEVEIPPQPVLNTVEVQRLTARDFPPITPPRLDGPKVCIVDSGIASNHPLLARNVAESAAVMSSAGTPADEHGHGTMVAGLSVFGNVRACYTSGKFSSPIRLFSVRVLDRQNRFDDEQLIINQIERAILTYYDVPHRCRVFNLSVGSATPAFEPGAEKQTIWAEALDLIARKLKILLVVSAGNFNEIFGLGSVEAENVLTQYPRYLLEHSARLNDPATSAISITVGALAEHATAALRSGIGSEDIVRPIAPPRHPSPFTRLGHGLNGAIKPEFVEYGGNAVFKGTGNTRHIGQDQGTSVMSFSNQPLNRLFAFDCGTSLAAPVVAREAAIVWHRLTALLGSEPDPNLVRAVLASAAEVPDEVKRLFRDENDMYRIAGYGQIDSDLANSSSDRRVTLVAQGSLALDKFAIYSVPITTALNQAPGMKHIRVV